MFLASFVAILSLFVLIGVNKSVTFKEVASQNGWKTNTATETATKLQPNCNQIATKLQPIAQLDCNHIKLHFVTAILACLYLISL